MPHHNLGHILEHGSWSYSLTWNCSQDKIIILIATKELVLETSHDLNLNLYLVIAPRAWSWLRNMLRDISFVALILSWENRWNVLAFNFWLSDYHTQNFYFYTYSLFCEQSLCHTQISGGVLLYTLEFAWAVIITPITKTWLKVYMLCSWLLSYHTLAMCTFLISHASNVYFLNITLTDRGMLYVTVLNLYISN